MARSTPDRFEPGKRWAKTYAYRESDETTPIPLTDFDVWARVKATPGQADADALIEFYRVSGTVTATGGSLTIDDDLGTIEVVLDEAASEDLADHRTVWIVVEIQDPADLTPTRIVEGFLYQGGP